MEYDCTNGVPASLPLSAGAAKHTFGEFTAKDDISTRMHKFTAGTFDSAIGLRGYDHEREFVEIFERVATEWKNSEVNRSNAIEFMAHLMNSASAKGFDVPPGWVKGLSELRRAKNTASQK